MDIREIPRSPVCKMPTPCPFGLGFHISRPPNGGPSILDRVDYKFGYLPYFPISMFLISGSPLSFALFSIL